MRKSSFLLCGVLASIMVPTVASAKDNIFLMGPRAMAMGGAYVAIAEDDSARYWNPAAVASLDTWYVEGRVDSMVSSDTYDLAQKADELTDLMDQISDDNNNDKSVALKTLEDDFVTPLSTSIISVNVAPTGGISIPHMGPIAVGIGGYAEADAVVYLLKNQTIDLGMPSLEIFDDYFIYDIKIDQVAMLTLGYEIEDLIPMGEGGMGNLSLGVNIKQLERYRYSDVDDPITVLDLKDEGVEFDDLDSLPNAKTIGYDIGLHSRLNKWLSAGIVLQDIGMDLTYTTPENVTREQPDEKINSNLRVGTAIKPLAFFDKENKWFDLTLSADLDNVDGSVREDSNFVDKTHVGVEAELNMWSFMSLALRAGVNQGFSTYGAKLKALWMFEADYAFYGDELADYHVLSVGINF